MVAVKKGGARSGMYNVRTQPASCRATSRVPARRRHGPDALQQGQQGNEGAMQAPGVGRPAGPGCPSSCCRRPPEWLRPLAAGCALHPCDMHAPLSLWRPHTSNKYLII